MQITIDDEKLSEALTDFITGAAGKRSSYVALTSIMTDAVRKTVEDKITEEVSRYVSGGEFLERLRNTIHSATEYTATNLSDQLQGTLLYHVNRKVESEFAAYVATPAFRDRVKLALKEAAETQIKTKET